MPVGILALQGAFAEHLAVFGRLGAPSVLVRGADQLPGLSGLVLPGGESTSMRRLAAERSLDVALRDFVLSRPVWGVCAGLILLAARIEGETPFLDRVDMTVARNAYGRQGDSFVADLDLPCLGPEAFPGVFIRAPRVLRTGPEVEVLGRLGDAPVALRQGRVLATTFHPELTDDPRLHQMFLDMCEPTLPPAKYPPIV